MGRASQSSAVILSFAGSIGTTGMGNFVWYELATADIKAAKAFYAKNELGHRRCLSTWPGL